MALKKITETSAGSSASAISSVLVTQAVEGTETLQRIPLGDFLSDLCKPLGAFVTVYNGYYAQANGKYTSDSRYKCFKIKSSTLPFVYGATGQPTRYVFMLNDVFVASYTPATISSELPEFDEVRINYKTENIPGDIAVFTKDMLGNVTQYPIQLTAENLSDNGWDKIGDLPTNYIYQTGSDITSDSFTGLKIYETNSTLIVLQASRRVFGSSWAHTYIQIAGGEGYAKFGTSEWGRLTLDDETMELINKVKGFDMSLASLRELFSQVGEQMNVYAGAYNISDGSYFSSQNWRCFKVRCSNSMPFIFGTSETPSSYMFYNGGQFIKGYRTASSPLLPDNIEDLLEDLGSSFDTVGVNYNVNTIPSGRGDVYAYSPDMFGNCLQYPVTVTSSVATAKGWESISDMPSNMIYQVNNTVPDSFGLKWSGANSTLIILQAANRTARSAWDRMYLQCRNGEIAAKVGDFGWQLLTLETTVDNILSNISLLRQDVDDLLSAADMRGISILFMGNSFTKDEVGYVPELLREAFPNMRCTIGIMFKGGCRLSQHYSYMINDTPYPNYYEYDWENGTWITSADVKLSAVITRHRWDIICFQQGAATSTDYSTFQPYLNDLINGYIKMLGHNVKFVYNMAHAYGDGDPRLGTTVDDVQLPQTSDDFFAAQCTAVQSMLVGTGISDYIPSGTAVQNARTTSIDDMGTDPYGHMCVDSGSHLQNGVPRLAPSYVVFAKICEWSGKPYAGFFGSQITPDTAWMDAHNVPAGCGNHRNCQGVDASEIDDYRILSAKCATAALKKPFEITDCSDM